MADARPPFHDPLVEDDARLQALDNAVASRLASVDLAAAGKRLSREGLKGIGPAAEIGPVTPFAEAYPTPWRISGCGQEIQDRDGNHVNAADLDDPDEREFWRGIVAAVNGAALLAEARPFVVLGLEALASSCKMDRELNPLWETLPDHYRYEHEVLTSLIERIDAATGEGRTDG